MAHRDLFLAAYDIRHPRRLAATLAAVRAYATSSQKSVHELFLTAAEKRDLQHTLSLLLEAEDRFFLIRLDPRSRIFTLGVATRPEDPDFYYVG